MIQAFRAFLSHDGRTAPRAPLTRLKLVRRFAQGNDGMTTVEFGLVALPFLALLFAILETTMIFFASQTLETAVADAARLVLTGQAQSQGFAPSDFRTAVCARVHGLLDCQNGLQIDVRTYASFSAINNAPPVDLARQSADGLVRIHAGQRLRHRRGAADVPVAGLYLDARARPSRQSQRQQPADHGDGGVPQRAVRQRELLAP